MNAAPYNARCRRGAVTHITFNMLEQIMRLFIAVLAVGVVSCALIGCKNKDVMNNSMDIPYKMSSDDCPHCPGVQTANPDGTCPKCGAKVK